jgi:hypothetical protein
VADKAADAERGKEGKTRRDVQFWLDVAVKLTVPLGAIVAAFLANYFEQNRANLTLLNQREQAESSLRATMFGQLISPIAGMKEGTSEIDPIRYAVLAQLLTLNFHEHIELKPLLQDADDRLAAYRGNAVTNEKIRDARSNLRQAAHRVIQRQIAKLWDDEIVSCTPKANIETTFQFVSDRDLEQSMAQDTASSMLVPGGALKSFTVSSPDCRDRIAVLFAKPDYANEQVHVLITPAEATSAAAKAADEFRFDFALTSFAFPFTDNAVLPDGNRFAFFIKDVSELDDSGTSKIMRVGLRWFPRTYYPQTERPTDYTQVKRTLGSVAK